MWRFHTDPNPTPSVAFKMPTKNKFFMRVLLITYNHIYKDPEQDPDPYKPPTNNNGSGRRPQKNLRLLKIGNGSVF
jgi:hypothetical protein